MRVTRQIVCFLCLTLLTNSAWSASPETEVKLQELIQAIQKNERLYQSLKVELTRTHTDELTWLSIPSKERIQRVAKISLVTQGKQFREQIREEGEYAVISLLSVTGPRNFQLPTTPFLNSNPIWISVSRDKPRHSTMLPGGGSFPRAR
tara:strand:+ start:1920 stop:2366 length:447 start_codon:yes stop_codon:yes gene_type:complete